MMRYYITKVSPIATIIGFLSFAQPAHAMDVCQAAGANFSGLCNMKLENSGGIAGAIVQLILIIGILIALIYLVWGGVRWIMSGGDRAKIAAARGQIVHALIGLVIAFAAFAIINFVLMFFTGSGLAGMSIPRLID